MLWTADTWSRSCVKQTDSSSSTRSLLPPLAGRAIGTGTVSVLCFARGDNLACFQEQQAWMSHNELCTDKDCGSTLYYFQVLRQFTMDSLQMFPLGSSSSIKKFIGVMMSGKYKQKTTVINFNDVILVMLFCMCVCSVLLFGLSKCQRLSLFCLFLCYILVIWLCYFFTLFPSKL